MMRALTLLAVLAVGSAGAADVVVREFRGIGGTDTGSFAVSSPWLVEWRSRPPTSIDHKPAHLEVNLYNASNNQFVGRVVQHAGVGGGDVLIEQTGRFLFRVQGQATEWQLKVIQVDAAYAERLKEAKREREGRERRR